MPRCRPAAARGTGLETPMSNAFVIEVAGMDAGIVVEERGGFRFFSSDHTFRAMENRCFRRIDDARRAALLLAEKGRDIANRPPVALARAS